MHVCKNCVCVYVCKYVNIFVCKCVCVYVFVDVLCLYM